MAAHPLLPSLSLLSLDGITIRDGTIIFAVRTTARAVSCPLCHHAAERTHSRYRRTLLDLPWQGNAVRIEVRCRKFFCDNDECPRRIFAEPLPTIAARYSRKTSRLLDALRELVYLAGGEAAARIARAFGLLVSPDALLNHIKRAPSVEPDGSPTPRVLGIDDFAFRRGKRYGTILVDLERHCPVDLLANRNADTLASWLQSHPGVEIANRDRSSEYARGIQKGAPDAVQVADRFHLLTNLREVIRRVVDRYRARLKGIELPRSTDELVLHTRQPERSAAAEAVGIAHHQECLERHRQIHDLLREGLPKRTIARKLNLSPMTVYKYLRQQETDITRRTCRSSSQLDPFVPYLSRRWTDGCNNATQLWRELKQRGYPGTARMVLAWAHQQRQAPAPSTPNRYRMSTDNVVVPAGSPAGPKIGVRTSSSRQFSWFLLKMSTAMSLSEQAVWERMRLACPELIAVQQISQQFQEMVREHSASDLDSWLSAVLGSREPALVQFAEGLVREKPSIVAALSLPWSNGQTEGQVNRLKFLKRQMYGRAGFHLLRARVMPLVKAA